MADTERDTDIPRPASTMVKDGRGLEVSIDQYLVDEPASEPDALSGWLPEWSYLTTPSDLSKTLVDAVSSVAGVVFLFVLTAGLVLTVTTLEFKMNAFDAAAGAGCAGFLSPVIAIVAIKVIDLALRVALLVIGVGLAMVVLGLLQQMLFGR